MTHRVFRHADHLPGERCYRCADMPLWAEELGDTLARVEELIIVTNAATQADIDAETVAIEANTAKLGQVDQAVLDLEAQIAANPSTPAASLDLSALKAAVQAQSDAASADVATLPVAPVGVVVPPGTNPADVLQTATGVSHPDPIAAAAATNPGSLPVDPILDATAIDAPVQGVGAVTEIQADGSTITTTPNPGVVDGAPVDVATPGTAPVDPSATLLANSTDPNNVNGVSVDGALAGVTDPTATGFPADATLPDAAVPEAPAPVDSVPGDVVSTDGSPAVDESVPADQPEA